MCLGKTNHTKVQDKSRIISLLKNLTDWSASSEGIYDQRKRISVCNFIFYACEYVWLRPTEGSTPSGFFFMMTITCEKSKKIIDSFQKYWW